MHREICFERPWLGGQLQESPVELRDIARGAEPIEAVARPFPRCACMIAPALLTQNVAQIAQQLGCKRDIFCLGSERRGIEQRVESGVQVVVRTMEPGPKAQRLGLTQWIAEAHGKIE